MNRNYICVVIVLAVLILLTNESNAYEVKSLHSEHRWSVDFNFAPAQSVPQNHNEVSLSASGLPSDNLSVSLAEYSGNNPHIVPTYQASGGISYQPDTSPNTLLHLGYQYFASLTNNVWEHAEHLKLKASAHKIEARVKLSF